MHRLGLHWAHKGCGQGVDLIHDMQRQYHRASCPMKSGSQTRFSTDVLPKNRDPTLPALPPMTDGKQNAEMISVRWLAALSLLARLHCHHASIRNPDP